MLIDSGAYSAFRLGLKINLDDYIQYVKDNQDWIEGAVSMDVINPDDTEAAAAAGWDNFNYMRKAGVEPIPVFHAGEDISWLYRYLDAGVEYLGISASTLRHNPGGDADKWYELIWKHLTDSEGFPIVKVHGFGEGRPLPMKTYPWWSCDSASWLYAAQRGGVFKVVGETQQFAFRNDSVSTPAMPDVGDLSELDLEAMEVFMQRMGLVTRLFDRSEGISPRRAYTLRTYCTCLYYLDIEKQVSALQPIKAVPRGLLWNKPNTRDMVDISDGFRCHMVAGGNSAALCVLARAGARHTLASYAHIKHFKQYNVLNEYAYDPIGTCYKYPRLKQYMDVIDSLLRDAAA